MISTGNYLLYMYKKSNFLVPDSESRYTVIGK